MPLNPELLANMVYIGGCCTTFVGVGVFAATSRWTIRREMQDVSSSRSDPEGEKTLRQEKKQRPLAHVTPSLLIVYYLNGNPDEASVGGYEAYLAVEGLAEDIESYE